MAVVSTSDARTLPIDEAVSVLGISRRTIERRRDGRSWLVEIPATAPSEVEQLRARVVELIATVEQLTASDGQMRARVAELEKALAVAEARFEAADAERDYLRQTHAAALSLSQRLLLEPTRAERAWWAFWRH